MQKAILFFLLVTYQFITAQDVKVLDLKSNDLIYLSSRDKLYMTTGEGVLYENSLCVIDPYHGTIDTCYYIGGSPGVMAYSDDQQYIYIGLESSPEVVRFAIADESISLRIPLAQNGNPEGQFFAEDIAVVPGAPEVIAVALKNPKTLPWQAGIVIYENEIQRAVTLPESMGSNSITFDTETGFLYGYRNETNSDLGLQKMYVNENGVFMESNHIGLLDRVYDEIKYANGRLYSNMGKVIRVDDDTFNPEGPFDVGKGFPVVEPIADSSFLYFLNTENTSISLETYDKVTFAKREQINFPSIKGNPYKLIQWGEEGKVAFLTRDYLSDFYSRLVIIRYCLSALTEAPLIETAGTACLGDTISLYSYGEEGPVFWSHGQTGPEAQLYYSDVIFCAIADELGCLSPSSESLLVTFYSYPTLPFIFPSPDELTLYSATDYTFGMQWFLNGVPVPGADSTILEITESGIYTFQVNWEGCLSPISNEIAVIISHTQKPLGNTSHVFFPNPVIDKFSLRFLHPKFQKGYMHIYASEGKLLSTQPLIDGLDIQEFSLAGLPAGLYTVQAISEKGELIAISQLVKY